jgi:hypothetical protein
MLTPVKQNSATDAHKWFKEYMAIANLAEPSVFSGLAARQVAPIG